MKLRNIDKVNYSERAPLITLSVILTGLVVARLVYATPPNPGHYFTEIGGGVAQGDILFGVEDDMLAKLAKDTDGTKYLSNTGTDNNPVWAQIDLTNGVTGDLSVNNFDSGNNADSSTFWSGDGSWKIPEYKTFVGGGSSTSITASAVCNPMGYSVCNTALGSMMGATVPYNGVIKNLYGSVQIAPEEGSDCIFTVRKSASCTDPYEDTQVSCSVSGDGAIRNCSDTSNSESISAGDCIQIYYQELGTCTGIINWGFEITAE